MIIPPKTIVEGGNGVRSYSRKKQPYAHTHTGTTIGVNLFFLFEQSRCQSAEGLSAGKKPIRSTAFVPPGEHQLRVEPLSPLAVDACKAGVSLFFLFFVRVFEKPSPQTMWQRWCSCSRYHPPPGGWILQPRSSA